MDKPRKPGMSAADLQASLTASLDLIAARYADLSCVETAWFLRGVAESLADDAAAEGLHRAGEYAVHYARGFHAARPYGGT